MRRAETAVFINCLPREIFNNALIKTEHSTKNHHEESKQQLKCTYVKIGIWNSLPSNCSSFPIKTSTMSNTVEKTHYKNLCAKVVNFIAFWKVAALKPFCVFFTRTSEKDLFKCKCTRYFTCKVSETEIWISTGYNLPAHPNGLLYDVVETFLEEPSVSILPEWKAT